MTSANSTVNQTADAVTDSSSHEPQLLLGSTQIVDTFAEAFSMRFTRLVVTAHDRHWLDAGIREFCGYSSSVIACDLEIGVDRYLTPEETPDGRLGVALLAFGFSTDALIKAVPNRTGQCLMTCPTTAVYNGLPDADEKIPLGKHIRFFGDGFQKSKQIAGRRYWRIPVMDGEFLIEDAAGVAKGVAGGNVIIQGSTLVATLSAARRAVDAVAALGGAITPFPGGVARSGSKVGSQYKQLKASTSDAYCPSLRGRVESKLLPGVHTVLEIVIDAISDEVMSKAMLTALTSAAGDGIVAVTAGNYGGKLGKYHYHLHRLLQNRQ